MVVFAVILGVLGFFFFLSLVSEYGSYLETKKLDRMWEDVLNTEGHPCRFCSNKMRHWKSYTGMDYTNCTYLCGTFREYSLGNKLYQSESDLGDWDYGHDYR